jgi:hypothetical protein
VLHNFLQVTPEISEPSLFPTSNAENGREDNELSTDFGGGEEERQEKENEREENGFFQSKQKSRTGNLRVVQGSSQSSSKIAITVSHFLYLLLLTFLLAIVILVTALTHIVQKKEKEPEIKLVSVIFNEL